MVSASSFGPSNPLHVTTSTVEVWEKGGPHCLLTFYWIEELDWSQVTLQDCISSWITHYGMKSAYYVNAPCSSMVKVRSAWQSIR